MIMLKIKNNMKRCSKLTSGVYYYNRNFHNNVPDIKLGGSHVDNNNHSQYTYVSKHNTSLNISSTDILHHYSLHNLQPSTNHRITRTHVIIHTCPFCIKPTHGKQDNLYKLYVEIGGGAYFCHRCGGSGSWYDLSVD